MIPNLRDELHKTSAIQPNDATQTVERQRGWEVYWTQQFEDDRILEMPALNFYRFTLYSCKKCALSRLLGKEIPGVLKQKSRPRVQSKGQELSNQLKSHKKIADRQNRQTAETLRPCICIL
jgi:hypothetical protein